MEERRRSEFDGPYRSHRSYRSHGTYKNDLIATHGGYRRLKSYQAAEIIYDATKAFCTRFLSRHWRMTDQMVQAARSGKQNIAEGCQASGTSKRTELRLIGVARASLEELLLDYEDFLRQRDLCVWSKDHPHALVIRQLAYRSNRSYSTYRAYVEQAPPEVAANTMVCLTHQANFLLDRQLRHLERRFLDEGGFTERLYAARRRVRLNRTNRANGSDRSDGANEFHP